MKLYQAYKYVDPFILLVQTPEKLTRVFCPFTVKAITDGEGLSEGQQYQVVKVELSTEHRLVYIIHRERCPYELFRIVL